MVFCLNRLLCAVVAAHQSFLYHQGRVNEQHLAGLECDLVKSGTDFVIQVQFYSFQRIGPGVSAHLVKTIRAGVAKQNWQVQGDLALAALVRTKSEQCVPH